MSRRIRLVSLALAAACAVTLGGAASAAAEFGYLGSFGSVGSTDGQFALARGVGVDPAGNVYVADEQLSRVTMFDSSGSFLTKWGTAGSGPGQFKSPYDVAADGVGNVYVADVHNSRVQKFSVDTSTAPPTVAFVLQFGVPSGGAEGSLDRPISVASGTGSNVYVGDSNRLVHQFNGSTGVFVRRWGTHGTSDIFSASNQLGVATDAAGNVHTLEPDISRVQRFGAEGAFLGEFTASAGGVPFPQNAWGDIAVDPVTGNIYLAPYNTGNGRFARFAPDGTFIDFWDCEGDGGGIGTSASGKAYFTTNTSVQVFGEGGAPCTPPPPDPDQPPGQTAGLVFQGNEGVTINTGAQFTRDAVVQLTIEHPENATNVRLSNDGGFQTSRTDPIAGDRLYTWELDSSGPERLPKTVYVRFANESVSSPLNFTDDIILDQTPPEVESAAVTGGNSTPAAVAARRRFTVRTRARDNASGVAKMRLAVRRATPGKLRPYRKRLTIRATRAPRFVRVFDGAGNRSPWRRVRRR